MKKTCETKEKLMQVGFDLMWDNSYGSVSVDDICKRAGINKGSFYHFFPSKADLVVAAYEEHWKEKRPMMDSIFSPQIAAAGTVAELLPGDFARAAGKGRKIWACLRLPLCEHGLRGGNTG